MDNRLQRSLFINERFFIELFLVSPWVKDIFVNGNILKREEVGEKVAMASSNARVESSVVPAHHAEQRRMWVGLSEALPAARPARRGHGLPQSRASLGPGRVCWMFMDGGSGRKCELGKLFSPLLFLRFVQQTSWH